MYKLMLVDDEYIVRHQVINKIDWHSYGFEIVCEAENGSEAYELFELHQPDVVITDIKMPFMDGLELSSKILAKYPYTKIIVLTGFDEFEYAKKGIDLHITNYVLKPVSSKELIRILGEVKKTIDDEIEHRRDVDRLRRHYERSYDLMRSRFLEGLVRDTDKAQDLREWLTYYEIDLLGSLYMASVIQIDNNFEDKEHAELVDLEYRKIALLDLVKEVDEQFDLGEYFLDGKEVVILKGSEGSSYGDFVRGQMTKMEKLRQAVERYLPYTVTIGCGQVCQRLENLHQSKDGAISACDYKLLMGTNQVIYISDLEKNVIDDYDFNDRDQRSLARMIKAGAVSEFDDKIEEVFTALLKTELTQQLMTILQLFTVVIESGKALGLSQSDLADEQLMGILGKDESLLYKKERILKLGHQIIDLGVKSRQHTNSALVLEAKAYVEANYKDWELNIEKISAHLHYSPNYFSSMFKKENGQSFMNYLLNMRVEKAKELLATTDMKNFEIAMEVGFSSANYFSYSFKKETQQSPSVYRKTLKSEG